LTTGAEKVEIAEGKKGGEGEAILVDIESHEGYVRRGKGIQKRTEKGESRKLAATATRHGTS